MIEILCLAIVVYTYILFGAIILSFALAFGWRPPPPLQPIVEALRNATDPVLNLFRRYVPPLGGFDFSPIFVFLILRFAQSGLGC